MAPSAGIWLEVRLGAGQPGGGAGQGRGANSKPGLPQKVGADPPGCPKDIASSSSWYKSSTSHSSLRFLCPLFIKIKNKIHQRRLKTGKSPSLKPPRLPSAAEGPGGRVCAWVGEGGVQSESRFCRVRTAPGSAPLWARGPGVLATVGPNLLPADVMDQPVRHEAPARVPSHCLQASRTPLSLLGGCMCLNWGGFALPPVLRPGGPS